MLRVLKNSTYLWEEKDGVLSPFFWLGDTAWLLLQKLDLEEAERYFKNRSGLKFNVIQAVLCHDENFRRPETEIDLSRPEAAGEFWEKAEAVTALAEKHGLRMAWLPVWGSMVKKSKLTRENVRRYALFLAERFEKFENVIWVLGGDIRGDSAFEIWETFAKTLRERDPEKLITYHPFGRTCSKTWFGELLDFDMFQSGHRRYDQRNLGAWDDGDGDFFGEDNWRYVSRCLDCENPKPVLDGEPSYEGIHQGLHDFSQPRWRSGDVRRYAYWSVFEGACGHTYGANSVMQFRSPKDENPAYDAEEYWTEGINLPGAKQMKYLREIITSADFEKGAHNEALAENRGYEKYQRVTAFSGKDFAYVYNFTGRPFALNPSALEFEPQTAEWFDPADGTRTPANVTITEKITPPKNSAGETDMVLVLRKDKQGDARGAY